MDNDLNKKQSDYRTQIPTTETQRDHILGFAASLDITINVHNIEGNDSLIGDIEPKPMSNGVPRVVPTAPPPSNRRHELKRRSSTKSSSSYLKMTKWFDVQRNDSDELKGDSNDSAHGIGTYGHHERDSTFCDRISVQDIESDHESSPSDGLKVAVDRISDENVNEIDELDIDAIMALNDGFLFVASIDDKESFVASLRVIDCIKSHSLYHYTKPILIVVTKYDVNRNVKGVNELTDCDVAELAMDIGVPYILVKPGIFCEIFPWNLNGNESKI